jgi:hypothetical protein
MVIDPGATGSSPAGSACGASVSVPAFPDPPTSTLLRAFEVSGGYGLPYHERIAKDVWDAQRDPALLQRLRKRAESEPELDALFTRRNM